MHACLLRGLAIAVFPTSAHIRYSHVHTSRGNFTLEWYEPVKELLSDDKTMFSGIYISVVVVGMQLWAFNEEKKQLGVVLNRETGVRAATAFLVR